MNLSRRLLLPLVAAALLAGCAGQTLEMPGDDGAADVSSSETSGGGAGRISSSPVEAGP